MSEERPGDGAQERRAAASKSRRRPPPRPPSLPRVGTKGESAEAKRQAAVVLEVLGGVRTPTDAAGALGISLPRYYVLEGRALEGLLGSLEPRPRGPRRSPERQLERTQRELERTEHKRARAEALLRAQGRVLGLKAPQAPTHQAGKRKKRRPVVRALRAAAVLRSTSAGSSGGLEASGGKEENAHPAKA